MTETVALARRELLVSGWPAADLESVILCPICNSDGREKLYDALWDNTAFVAPGSWTLWRCNGCKSAYLSPRPTPTSIGRAYENYYTHAHERREGANGPTPEASLRTRLANGYRNWRFGTDAQPSSKLGKMIGMLLPAIRRSSDYKYRYLPAIGGITTPRLLDLGCGSGRWLSMASKSRWHVCGSDPDPRAIAHARANGLDARHGGLEVWADKSDYFDAITISHVIEHVHDPKELLAGSMRLLKPGGSLYVETPNIRSLGHKWFRRSWRGLEPPRHLVIFNQQSLCRLLREVGFVKVCARKGPSQLDFIIAVSEDLERLDGPSECHRDRTALAKWWLKKRSNWTTSRAEFLMITCERPAN